MGQVDQNRMAQLYQEADIYLNTSNEDNMPISILEAFASGTPVVSTNAGGISYIAEDKQTALLVRLNNEELVADAVFRLVENEGLGSRLAENARDEVEKYLWESVGPSWISTYQRVYEKY